MQAIYDHLPSINCKGLCVGACGLIPLTEVELEYVLSGMLVPVPPEEFVAAVGRSGLTLIGDEATCPLLVDGRCSVYNQRPFVCRAYGIVADPRMRCEFGCEPEALLTRKEVDILIRDINQLNAETK